LAGSLRAKAGIASPLKGHAADREAEDRIIRPNPMTSSATLAITEV
jgi:hypothetical protein